MSQFGMQMPAGRKRSASPDVYTGLAVIATVFLAGASFVVYGAGSKIGKEGQPFGLQSTNPKEVKLKDQPAAAAPAPRAAPAPSGGAAKKGA